MAGLRRRTSTPLSCDPSGESNGFSWHPGSAVPQLAPPLAQSASVLCLCARRIKRFPRSGGIPFVRSHSGFSAARVGFSFVGCLTLRSTRTPPALPSALSQLLAILGSAHRLGAGGAG